MSRRKSLCLTSTGHLYRPFFSSVFYTTNTAGYQLFKIRPNPTKSDQIRQNPTFRTGCTYGTHKHSL